MLYTFIWTWTKQVRLPDRQTSTLTHFILSLKGWILYTDQMGQGTCPWSPKHNKTGSLFFVQHSVFHVSTKYIVGTLDVYLPYSGLPHHQAPGCLVCKAWQGTKRPHQGPAQRSPAKKDKFRRCWTLSDSLCIDQIYMYIYMYKTEELVFYPCTIMTSKHCLYTPSPMLLVTKGFTGTCSYFNQKKVWILLPWKWNSGGGGGGGLGGGG